MRKVQRAMWRASPHSHNNDDDNNSADLLRCLKPRAILRCLYRHNPLGLVAALVEVRALRTREDS